MDPKASSKKKSEGTQQSQGSDDAPQKPVSDKDVLSQSSTNKSGTRGE